MTRRCSHCSNDGHNLRTCPNKGVKVFGVRFDLNQTAPMRRSVSMGNLSQYVGSGGAAAEASNGYASDGYEHRSSLRERKKGTAWTKEEHRQFLLGLEALGKGDWRGIARMYVPSRTSTQVASHAQKYFNRLNHQSVRRRRSSLFDMVPEDLRDDRNISIHNQESESEANVLVAPPPQPLQTNHETNSSIVPNPPPPPPPAAAASNSSAPLYPIYCPPNYYPYFTAAMPASMFLPTPIFSTNAPSIVKPTPVHCTHSSNLNEIVDMSKLNLFERGNVSTCSAPVNIVGNSNRHSAFHGSDSPTAGSSPIHAV